MDHDYSMVNGQVMAPRALTNLVSRTSHQSRQFVGTVAGADSGQVLFIIELLSSPALDSCEQAVCALSKIFAGRPDLRNMVIKQDVVQQLVSLINPETPKSLLRKVSGLILSMCRCNDPPPPVNTFKIILRSLNVLIRHNDTEILVITAWIISCLTDGGNDKIQMVIESGVLLKLIPLLGHGEVEVQKLALRAVGNIVTGSDNQTQVVLNYDALSYFPALMSHSENNIQEEALWFLSNIIAGNQAQVQAIIDKGLLLKMIQNASKPNQQFVALQASRKLLSLADNQTQVVFNQTINDLVKSKILPILVIFLKQHYHTMVQYEAASALTKFASGSSDQRNQVVGAGAVPFLVQQLSSPALIVCEQAVCALSKIIAGRPDHRDMVIKQDVVESLVSLIKPDTPVSLLRNISWMILNMCRSKDPPPPANTIVDILPSLNVLIKHTDTKILVNTVWAISNVAEGGNYQIQKVLESGVLHKLIPLLGHGEVEVQKATLRAVGNIVTGSDFQTQEVLNKDALSYFPTLISHSDAEIRAHAVWFLSNINAGNQSQVQAVIDRGLLPTIIQNWTLEDFQTQKPTAWAITNLTITSNRQQVFTLISQGVISLLCNMLDCQDAEAIDVVLIGLYNMLQKCKPDSQQVADRIAESNGLEKILKFQSQNHNVAYKIITEYFLNGFAWGPLSILW